VSSDDRRSWTRTQVCLGSVLFLFIHSLPCSYKISAILEDSRVGFDEIEVQERDSTL
jgi:hypothetical protein